MQEQIPLYFSSTFARKPDAPIIYSPVLINKKINYLKNCLRSSSNKPKHYYFSNGIYTVYPKRDMLFVSYIKR